MNDLYRSHYDGCPGSQALLDMDLLLNETVPQALERLEKCECKKIAARHYGESIRSTRIKKLLTVRTFAKLIDVSVDDIEKIEVRFEEPSDEIKERIWMVLNATWNAKFQRDERFARTFPAEWGIDVRHIRQMWHKSIVIKDRTPTLHDTKGEDGNHYYVGKTWIDTVGQEVFRLTSINNEGLSIWKNIRQIQTYKE